ncbi:30S ribosomal protein S13 [Candidatus Pacearchaeota archaeon]|nr:MAG: 30S ribosomal protein S13 [Candidatus Pacearchaeota archaeon]
MAKGIVSQEKEEALVRIANKDIPGSKSVYVGLTRIKGVSWTISKALCLKLGLDLNRKVGSLSQEEIKKIEQTLANLDIPEYLMNRRRDPETGESKHYIGTELDLKRDFDLRRLKRIRSYRGLRHILGQPVRGQRTKAHFRQKSQLAKIRKKNKGK